MTTTITGNEWLLTRACAHCEQEAGVLDRKDATKTHGYCRRHFVELLKDDGMTQDEIDVEMRGFGPDTFCPDLQGAKE